MQYRLSLEVRFVEYVLSYYTTKMDHHFSNNLIAVAVLKERGTNMSGLETTYYPAQQIREWLQGIVKETENETLLVDLVKGNEGSATPAVAGYCCIDSMI
jgi:hypothetical protein